jgi:hypothetical protein
MRRAHSVLAVSALVMQAMACGSGNAAEAQSPTTGTVSPAGIIRIDWKAVERAMGRAGALQPGGVYRFSMPRSDLRVVAAGIHVKPALALGSWLAFKATPHGALAMGDVVLLEQEVAPVMSRLQEAGIEQTAVHHHLLHETPRVVYMHVHAHGDPVKIAELCHSPACRRNRLARLRKRSVSTPHRWPRRWATEGG